MKRREEKEEKMRREENEEKRQRREEENKKGIEEKRRRGYECHHQMAVKSIRLKGKIKVCMNIFLLLAITI